MLPKPPGVSTRAAGRAVKTGPTVHCGGGNCSTCLELNDTRRTEAITAPTARRDPARRDVENDWIEHCAILGRTLHLHAKGEKFQSSFRGCAYSTGRQFTSKFLWGKPHNSSVWPLTTFVPTLGNWKKLVCDGDATVKRTANTKRSDKQRGLFSLRRSGPTPEHRTGPSKRAPVLGWIPLRKRLRKPQTEPACACNTLHALDTGRSRLRGLVC